MLEPFIFKQPIWEKYRNIFFSEAIALIEPKLCINHWKVLYKLCVFYVDRNSKMTTTAGHSFYIGPIGSFYNQVNDTGSREALLWIICLGLDYSSSLHICKICHINAKYIINCHNSYDYIAYYCLDSHQMLVNFKRHVKNNIRHFFSYVQKWKAES